MYGSVVRSIFLQVLFRTPGETMTCKGVKTLCSRGIHASALLYRVEKETRSLNRYGVRIRVRR
jgi:hypothetical protein